MEITEQKLKIYDRILATVSTLAIIVAGIWSLWEIIETRKKENILLTQQIDLIKFNDKKAIYFELCDAEGKIAACNSYDEVLIAQKDFRKLYLGKAHIIADLDIEVNNQKIEFCLLLDKYLNEKSTERPFDYFFDATLKLSDICKRNLDLNSIYKKS
jgi:hypothetical protein